jgi:hypothetical protein
MPPFRMTPFIVPDPIGTHPRSPIAGHVSREMFEHYSHVRLDAKRQALDALSRLGKNRGYVTNHVTNTTAEDLSGGNYKKRLVGERGFEPPTPWSRSKEFSL